MQKGKYPPVHSLLPQKVGEVIRRSSQHLRKINRVRDGLCSYFAGTDPVPCPLLALCLGASVIHLQVCVHVAVVGSALVPGALP